jgi:hypothetical protein
MASQSSLLGAAGEHYVMSALLRRGLIAALAPAGVPNADIVVTDIEGGRLCSIQVKTRRDIGSDGGWHMKAKHEAIISDRLFYCFVDFGRDQTGVAAVFVLPSAVVAQVLRDAHRKWLDTPGMRGQQRQDSVMRRLLPDYTRIYGVSGNPYPKGWLEQYRHAWHLLGVQPQEVEAEAE